MAVNYMSMKHEDLFKLIEKYNLDRTDYVKKNDKGTEVLNVQKLQNVLKLIDGLAGRLEETITISQEGDVTTHNPRKKLNKELSGMMVLITFYNSDENDLPYVQLGLNGTALLVPREIESWIPKEFVEGVLVPAVVTKMKMDVDRDGKIRYIPKAVPRLSYTVKDIKHIDVLRKEYDEARKNNK